MAKFRIFGATAPFREAISQTLIQAGLEPIDESADEVTETEITEDDITLVYCDNEEAWELAAKMVVRSHVLCIITKVDILHYRRALALGAGVVYHDSISEIVAATALSISRREVLLPQLAAQQLAERSSADEFIFESPDLSRFEQQLIAGYLARKSWRHLADEFGYSARTLQRRIQHIKLHVGATTRDELARRFGGSDL